MELELFFGPPSLPANTTIESGFQNQMRDFYINFINDLNPGREFICTFTLATQAHRL